MLATRIFEIVLPLAAIVTIGLLYAQHRATDMDVANRLNMHLFVPALLFSGLTSQRFDLGEYLALALGGGAVVLVSGLLAWPLARVLGERVPVLVPPIMFGNVGNLGLPLALLALGNGALPGALVLFLVSTMLHLTLGAWLLDRNARLIDVFRQPMIIAAIAGVSASLLDWHIPEPYITPIQMLGRIAIPLMLFALGVKLSESDFTQWRSGLIAAVAAPLIGFAVALVMVAMLDLPRMQAGLLLLFGVMPPAVMNFILAERYGQESSRVAAMVVIGNAFALISIPLALGYVLPRYA